MKNRYTVRVNCVLDRAYEVSVEAEDEEMAYIEAEGEVYREIDPSHIDILATDILSFEPVTFNE